MYSNRSQSSEVRTGTKYKAVLVLAQINTYISTYIHMYIHTYVHTYTRTVCILVVLCGEHGDSSTTIETLLDAGITI